MNDASRGVWGGVAVVALLVSTAFSSHLLPRGDSPESDRPARVAQGLLASVSRKPEFAFGFRNVLSDVAWLQAVQVAGNRKMARWEYDRLYELLDVVSNFDPKFEIPYLLGGLVLGESPDHPREALHVFERGKLHHPADWRFPFYIGFTHYFSIGDPEAGGKAMAEAARVPGSPAYLPGLASRMLSEAREPEAAFRLLETILGQESDPARRKVLERRLREVAVERDLQILERAVDRYREEKGVVPRTPADLVGGGFLAALPEEPNGGNYVIDREGKVSSDRVSLRLRVLKRQ